MPESMERYTLEYPVGCLAGNKEFCKALLSTPVIPLDFRRYIMMVVNQMPQFP
jgi:hypothetical protein